MCVSLLFKLLALCRISNGIHVLLKVVALYYVHGHFQLDQWKHHVVTTRGFGTDDKVYRYITL